MGRARLRPAGSVNEPMADVSIPANRGLLASTSIGSKVVVAATGLGLSLFVLQHMIGNFNLYLGPEALNSYAHFLKSSPKLLWPARFGLLAIFVLHVVTALRLKRQNLAARPVKYEVDKAVQASWASRHMALTGILLLTFIGLHLAHYTLFWVHPEFANLVDSQGRHDVYRMVVEGFSVPWMSGIYIFAMIILGAHLWHGFQSLFQSLGLNGEKARPWLHRTSMAFAVVIVLGNISMPLAVLAGLID